VSSADRLVALAVGMCTLLSMMGGALAVLMRISWRVGQLVTRLDLHLREAEKVDARITELERERLVRRRRM